MSTATQTLRVDITENSDKTWHAKVFFDNVIAFGENFFLSKACAEDFVMAELKSMLVQQ